MEILISFYDNALIYYPNVFFLAVFFFSILGVIAMGIGIIVLWKKTRKVIQEINSNLKQIKRIRINEGKKIPFAQIIRDFFQRKSISLVYFIRALTIFFVNMIRIFFISINTGLEYIESQTERIVKRIGKEVLIEE